MVTQRIRCRRFIGRQKELTRLLDLSRNSRGYGEIVTIAAAAGLGKSRLISEYIAGLSREAVAYFTANCLQFVASPFAPFVSIIRSLVSSPGSELEDWQVEALAPILPELRKHYRSTSTVDPEDRRRQFDAICEILRQRASRGKFVIIIEDIHWSDSASLELLQYLAVSEGVFRPIVVATYRPAEMDENNARSAFAPLQRSIDLKVTLSPLVASDMDSLIANSLDDEHGVSPEVRRAVRARAEGNPLFAEELLKHVIENGTAAKQNYMPPSIRDTVMARFDELDREEQQILLHAAVIGRHFSVEFLSAITGVGRERVASVLRRARDLQLIEGYAENAGELRFRHALTRDALYDTLLVVEAQALHRRILETLEPPGDAAVSIHELAYHAWESKDADRCTAYNERAGDADMGVRAPGEAAIRFERALVNARSDAERGRLFGKLARAFDAAGEAKRAKDALESAVAHYKNIDAKREVADLYVNLGVAHDNLGDFEGHVSMLAQARDALEGLDADLERLTFDAFHDSGVGRVQEAHRTLIAAEKFLAGAQTIPRVRFYHTRAIVNGRLGQYAKSISDGERARELAAASGDIREVVLATLRLGYRCETAGRFAEALGHFLEASTLADRHWYLGYAARASAFAARQQWRLGDLRAARESLEKSLSFSTEGDAPATQQVQLEVGLSLGSRLVDTALLQTLSDRLGFDLRNPQKLLEYRFADVTPSLFEVLIFSGTADACDALNHAVDRFGFVSAAMLIMLGAYGPVRELPMVRERVVPHVKEWHKVLKVSLHLFDAYVARRRGQPEDEVFKPARAAIEDSHALGLPYEEALGLELIGAFHDALEIHKRTGNLRDIARLKETLTPRNRQGRAESDLTRREMEIAKLAASERSNKEIADALFITQRTVEKHMDSIFRKLQIRSRRELAGHLG